MCKIERTCIQLPGLFSVSFFVIESGHISDWHISGQLSIVIEVSNVSQAMSGTVTLSR